MAATNGTFGQQDQYRNSAEQYPATSGATEASGGNSDLSKDEIGWYFVEQYYTTLSKSPEKLHLFYSKRSQFVSGPEAEVAPVSVGRSAIQERIRDLDFQDCKVRVSNVDSQASDDNIVIQVIGETSNKSAELKKFVQTFVLAQQPTGYFVLNDIFRYISEEADEEVEAGGQEDVAQSANHEQLAEGVEMPKSQPAAEEQSQVDVDVMDVVDKKLEESAHTPPAVLTDAPATNGDGAGEAPELDTAEEAPAAATKPTVDIPNSETVEKALEEEDSQEAEKPKDPVPTPAVAQPSTLKIVPAQPAVPAKPMSWANRAAAAAAAINPQRPAVPNPKTSSPVPAPSRAPPATPSVQPAQAAQPSQQSLVTSAISNKENDPPQQSQNAGWQTAGSDHTKRQNRPQSISGPLEKEGTMGYVRNVTEAVKAEELRAALSSHGELVYFDINRQKNCAFVEFATTAGYQAAAAANPHEIGGESIVVEPRRPKSSAYGGAGYNGGRGGLNNRGRGGFDQGRPGNQRGRGDFGANRGRGAPRGRGNGQPPAV